MDNEIIDPLNLACGCSFTPEGSHLRMCEEAGRLRAVKNEVNLKAWLDHNKGSQPTLLVAQRLARLRLNPDTNGMV